MRGRWIAVSLALLTMTVIPHAGYAQKACTEIGCINGLMLRGEPERDWKNGNYNFDFVLDNRRVRCWGELPLKPCDEGPSLTCNKDGVQITESGCALPKKLHGFGDIMIENEPRKVLVRITHNNQTIVTRTIIPQYQTLWPNGPGCGPACSSASYNLFNTDP